MPRCVNDEKRTYSGSEPSPKGYGFCAHAEPIGKRMKGTDGNVWEIIVASNDVRRWQKVNPKVVPKVRPITDIRYMYTYHPNGDVSYTDLSGSKRKRSKSPFKEASSPKRGSSRKTKKNQTKINYMYTYHPNGDVSYTDLSGSTRKRSKSPVKKAAPKRSKSPVKKAASKRSKSPKRSLSPKRTYKPTRLSGIVKRKSSPRRKY